MQDTKNKNESKSINEPEVSRLAEQDEEEIIREHAQRLTYSNPGSGMRALTGHIIHFK